MDINAEIFGNGRLLAEGMPAPPKLTSHLQQCAMRLADRSVYQQLLEDE
jgi:hypothetical protein